MLGGGLFFSRKTSIFVLNPEIKIFFSDKFLLFFPLRFPYIIFSVWYYFRLCETMLKLPLIPNVSLYTTWLRSHLIQNITNNERKKYSHSLTTSLTHSHFTERNSFFVSFLLLLFILLLYNSLSHFKRKNFSKSEWARSFSFTFE